MPSDMEKFTALILIFCAACGIFLIPLEHYASAQTAILHDGDLFRIQGDAKVYVAKISDGKQYKRWFVAPEILGFYDFSPKKIKTIDKAEASKFADSALIRQAGQAPVWLITDATSGSGAKREWIPSPEVFRNSGFDWNAVFTVNNRELSFYRNNGEYANAGSNAASAGGQSNDNIASSVNISSNPGEQRTFIVTGTAMNPALSLSAQTVDGNAQITGITLTQTGVIPRGTISVSAVDSAGQHHGNAVIGYPTGNLVNLDFADNPVKISKGRNEIITIEASAVRGAGSSGSYTFAFQVSNPSDIRADARITGSFPIKSDPIIVISSNLVGSMDVNAIPAVNRPATAGNTGNTGVILGKFNFGAMGGIEGAKIESLSLTIDGTADISRLMSANWSLADENGAIIPASTSVQPNAITFNFLQPYAIQMGQSRTISVQVDKLPPETYNRWIRIHLKQSSDVVTAGTNSGLKLLPTHRGGLPFSDEYDTYIF
jgi:hypothetical protein